MTKLKHKIKTEYSFKSKMKGNKRMLKFNPTKKKCDELLFLEILVVWAYFTVPKYM